jgi:3',5'-cyclic AMP phosphodiesterase CpdA
MAESMLVAQITDCHVVAAGQRFSGRIDTGAGLRAAVRQLNTMRPRPDVVLATGDLVNDGVAEEYDHLATILAELEIALFAVPGNHDDRSLLRSSLDQVPPGGPDDRIDFVVEAYPLRLIGLDTTVPGDHGGESHLDQMVWLDRQLAAEPDRPTLIFQHHPPFPTGIAWMDGVGLRRAERQAEVIERHAHVVAVICGHVHRPISTVIGRAAVSIAPSTGAQVSLELDGTPYVYLNDTPAMALHHWDGVRLRSHVVQIGAHERWLPDWADEGATTDAVP